MGAARYDPAAARRKARAAFMAPPERWNPLDDYRVAQASRPAPSPGSTAKRHAVLAGCKCPMCAPAATA
ncbi:hypothetical protein GCM10010442_04590 [Kitasatospora kifunensis]|uniref:Uncharacterized protein n=1 Tax=Kitasatospora kifunensis TaxID=58351 RepID=A0A7W7QZX9_KITKI|nr:hypothetical protein [Kitasatospora kifunensis]